MFRVYNAPMPGVRGEGQHLVALAIHEDILKEVERSRKKAGRDRSTFIREALIDYLNARGASLNPELAFAPDRTGKGGRPRKRGPATPVPIGPSSTAAGVDAAVQNALTQAAQAPVVGNLPPPAAASSGRRRHRTRAKGKGATSA